MKAINLSPSFLSKVYERGYDYAVAEKLGMIEKDTKSMSDGRLMHEIIAEKLGGAKAKVVMQEFDNFRTKAAREWRDSQPDDVFIVTAEKLELFNSIADRVIAHPVVKELLGRGEVKVENIIEKEVGGYNVKGIIDALVLGDKKTSVDWKFVATQVFDDFARKAYYQHYDLQGATYDFLEEPAEQYFVTIENEAPHRIQVHKCSESFLIGGATKFMDALNIVKTAGWREPTFDIAEVNELKGKGE